jgi:hypothetical protein
MKRLIPIFLFVLAVLVTVTTSCKKETPDVKVAGITLDQKTATVRIGTHGSFG